MKKIKTPKTKEDFEYAVKVKLLKRFHQTYLDGKKKGYPQGFVEYFTMQHYVLDEVQKALIYQDRMSRESERERIMEFILSEEIEMQVGDNINDLLEYRGIYDCGKSMRGGAKEKVLEPLVIRIKRTLTNKE